MGPYLGVKGCNQKVFCPKKTYVIIFFGYENV